MTIRAPLLGIDFGEKKIGLALSSGNTALPFAVIPHDRHCVDFLEKLIAEEGITRVVVGLPFSLSGSENKHAKRVRKFIAVLSSALSVPVVAEDERFSTKAAHAAGSGSIDDAHAAAEILQTYLDAHGH